MNIKGLSGVCFAILFGIFALTPDCQAPPIGWTAHFGAGIATPWQRVITDAGGNVYVAGTVTVDESRSGVGLVKYNGNGKQLWSTTQHTADSGYEHLSKVTLGPDGNIYLLSVSRDPHTLAVSRFDSLGRRIWARVREHSWGGALAIDGAGNIFVAGTAIRPDGFPLGGLLVKYNSQGAELWAGIVSLDQTGMYNGRAVVPDGTGGAYLAGDMFIFGKFSSNGDLLWHRQHLGQWASFVFTDAQRNLCVVGTSGDMQALVVKVDPAGGEVWQTTHGITIPEFGYTQPVAAAIDDDGNIYVVSNCSDRMHDIAKLNARGKVLWNRQEFANQDFLPASLAVDQRGNAALFYTEALEVFRIYRPVLVRYKPNGNAKEVERFHQGFHLASDVAYAPGGEFVVTRYSEDANNLGSWITDTLRHSSGR